MMYVITCVVLTAILYGLCGLFERNQKKRFAPNEKELDTLALFLSKEDFYKTLNFMLMYGIIDFKEYTDIELKSLPFLKRSV